MELYTSPDMHTRFPTYVSRVVSVPARYAPTVFERWWLDGRRRSGAAPSFVAATDGGRLELDIATWNRPYPRSAITPYRQVRGRLRGIGIRSWPIELEMVPWSASHSAIGLRYAGSRMPGPRVLDRYHELVVGALECVGLEITMLGASYVAHVTREELDAA